VIKFAAQCAYLEAENRKRKKHAFKTFFALLTRKLNLRIYLNLHLKYIFSNQLNLFNFNCKMLLFLFDKTLIIIYRDFSILILINSLVHNTLKEFCATKIKCFV